jgi:hypothetical protein
MQVAAYSILVINNQYPVFQFYSPYHSLKSQLLIFPLYLKIDIIRIDGLAIHFLL